MHMDITYLYGIASKSACIFFYQNGFCLGFHEIANKKMQEEKSHVEYDSINKHVCGLFILKKE